MDEAIWKAILNCEPTFDGQYYYAVLTTGIFCRPSCRSRTPKRDNVRIFSSIQEAVQAGFRPCKRCRPDERPHCPDIELVMQMKDLIQRRCHERLTLSTVAKQLSISPYHLHRVFKRVTGMTPAQYIFRTRITRAMESLKHEHSKSIADIAFELGFRSLSHFSVVFRRATGRTPSEYRNHAIARTTNGRMTQ
jgi:AraC family transcriptional regulator, regulatory protein of adaptative response / methylphosphotriester-DNA alkyltransferase methyltransferase